MALAAVSEVMGVELNPLDICSEVNPSTQPVHINSVLQQTDSRIKTMKHARKV